MNKHCKGMNATGVCMTTSPNHHSLNPLVDDFILAIKPYIGEIIIISNSIVESLFPPLVTG